MDTSPIVDDATLVARIRGGDGQAWRVVYQRYADRCYNLCFSVLHDAEAADAAHDAFVVAMGRIDTLRDPSALRPWLMRIAWNEAVRRGKGRTRTLPAEDSVFAQRPSPDQTPEESFGRRELAELVRNATAGLTQDERVVLELDVHQGLRGDELARVIGVTPSYARKLTQRVRRRAGRALGALLVASRGGGDCAALAALLDGWDGRFSPLVRKRVARHIDGCVTCEANRSRLADPLVLLGSAPMIPAPTGIGDQLFAVPAAGAAAAGAPTSAGSYQVASWGTRRLRTAVLAGAAAAAVVAGAVFLVPRPDTPPGPVVMAQAGANSDAQVAVTGAGRPIVAWTGAGNRVYARIQTGDGTWSEPEELTVGFTGPRGVKDLVALPDGTVCAFWEGYADGDLSYHDSYGLYQRCTDGGGWSERSRTAANVADSWYPAVAPDGTVHTPWSRSSFGIGYQDQLLSQEGTNSFPLTAVDLAGRLHVLWWNGDLGYVHRRSDDDGRSWTETQVVNTELNAPRLVADDRGGLYLTSTTSAITLRHWTLPAGWSEPARVTDTDTTNGPLDTGLAASPNGCAAVIGGTGTSLMASIVDADAATHGTAHVPGGDTNPAVQTDVASHGSRLDIAWADANGQITYSTVDIDTC